MCCSEREQFQTHASWLKVKTIKKLSVLSYQFLGNYWFSIPLIAFTLNRLSYILFVVFLYCTLVAPKYQKARHTTKIVVYSFIMLTTPPYRIPCGANCVCTTHDYMLAVLSICKQIPRLSLSCRLCLPFQYREQKNSLHALPSSYGTYAQTLLFLFLNWNWHALLLKRCRISFWYYYCSRFPQAEVIS